jgi:hypothetical protein
MSRTRTSNALRLGFAALLGLAVPAAHGQRAAAQAGGAGAEKRATNKAADKSTTADKTAASDKTAGTDKTAAGEKTAAGDKSAAAEKGAAAASGKAKPAAVTDSTEPKTKVAKKSKKSKAKTDAPTDSSSASNEPPVPPGSVAVDAAAKSKPAGGLPTVREANATPVATTGDPNAAPKTPATKPATAPGTGGAPKASAAPVATAAKPGPKCSLDDPEQPRGGRLDVVGSGFGPSPLVRVAGKPVRMIERREDRISVQVPADSDGGLVAVQAQGVLQPCGNLVIIGKNR